MTWKLWKALPLRDLRWILLNPFPRLVNFSRMFKRANQSRPRSEAQQLCDHIDDVVNSYFDSLPAEEQRQGVTRQGILDHIAHRPMCRSCPFFEEGITVFKHGGDTHGRCLRELPRMDTHGGQVCRHHPFMDFYIEAIRGNPLALKKGFFWFRRPQKVADGSK